MFWWLSYIYDYIIYTKINERVPNIVYRLKYIPVVLIVFTLSILSAITVERIRIMLFNLYSKLTEKNIT